MYESFRKKLLKFDFDKIVGNSDVKKQIKSALYAKRPIILVGPPGIGKTTLAKQISELLDEEVVNDCGYNCLPDKPVCPVCLMKKQNNEPIKTKKARPEDLFIRIQGSPELTVEDIIGDIDPVLAMKFGANSLKAFIPGKLFKANNGVLFFDEINRCSEKLQNALLQVLEEKKITLGSYTFDFDVDFIFIATMNPEDSSTESLSDVFADRFDMIYLDYPKSVEEEKQILLSKNINFVDVPEKILLFIIKLVQNLRYSDELEKHPGVRATIGLYERAQTNALINKRNEVTVEDIKDVFVSVLAHRIRLKPAVAYTKTPVEFLNSILNMQINSDEFT